MKPAAYLLVSGTGRPLHFIIASTREEKAAAFAEARRISGVLVRAAVRLDCRHRRHRRRRRDVVAYRVADAVRAIRDALTPPRPRPDAEFDSNRDQLVAEFGEDGFRRMRRAVTSYYLAWPR